MKRLIANLKMSRKLFIGPLLVMLFLIVMGLLSYSGLTSQKASVEDIFNNRFKGYQTSAGILKDISQTHANLYKVISWANAQYDEKKVEALGKEQLAVVDRTLKTMGRVLSDAKTSDEEKKLYQASLAQLKEYKEAAASAVDLSGSDLNMATMYMATTDEKFQSLNGSLQQILALEEKLSQEKYDSTLKNFAAFIVLLLVVLGSALAVSLVVNILMTRLIAAPIHQTIKAVDQIAAGDLTRNVGLTSKDEIGDLARSVDAMREKMGEAVGGAVATSQALSEAASEQAASLEETSSSLEEMAARTQNNAENTDRASELMTHSNAVASKANASMSELNRSMKEIAGASETDPEGRQVHRRDRLPDQPAGPECGGGSGPRRRGGGGLCRRGRRGAKPGHAGGRGGQEHGQPDGRDRAEGPEGRTARGPHGKRFRSGGGRLE